MLIPVQTAFLKNMHKYIVIELSNQECLMLRKHAMYQSQMLNYEDWEKIDIGGSVKRFYNGNIGEYAICKLLGVPFYGSNIGGSRNNNIPDIVTHGYRLGVKTVSYGNPWKINKHSGTDEIMCVIETLKDISDTAENDEDSCVRVYICGIASAEVQDKYNSGETYVYGDLHSKGNKVSYFAYDKLLPLNLTTLSTYKTSMTLKEKTRVEKTDWGKRILYIEGDGRTGIYYGVLKDNKIEGFPTNKFYAFSYRNNCSDLNSFDFNYFTDVLRSVDFVIGWGSRGLLSSFQMAYGSRETTPLEVNYIDISDIQRKCDWDGNKVINISCLENNKPDAWCGFLMNSMGLTSTLSPNILENNCFVGCTYTNRMFQQFLNT